MVNSTGFELDWPADLLETEIDEVGGGDEDRFDAEEVAALLADAFHTDVASLAYRSAVAKSSGSARAWLADLIADLPTMPRWVPRRPLLMGHESDWPENRTLLSDYTGTVVGLRDRGYFNRVAARCSAEVGEEVDVDDAVDSELRRKLPGESRRRIWPPNEAGSDRDLHVLIEAVHDLVGRPRRGPDDVTTIDVPSGQRIYRGLVNEVLARHQTGLHLAATGAERGRLTQVTDLARADLLDRVSGAGRPAREEVAHAVSLFRSTHATLLQKRSAILVLAGILEERRPLLREKLHRKDEAALFYVANTFGLRHQNAAQRDDYAEEFLDWIFWWYLATVELTDAIVTRDTPEPVASAEPTTTVPAHHQRP